MLTRKDYLEGRCSFEDYYGEIVKAAGISYAHHPELDRFERCLANGDEHLNTISLRTWDVWAAGLNSPRLGAIFKERGDYTTVAGLVCVAKTAARLAVAEREELEADGESSSEEEV